MINSYQNNPKLREIFEKTSILRHPVSGIVSGYHELPYILIAPDDKNSHHSIEITGKIQVSPKIVLSASYLNETFGEVFDPDTFNQDIQGRIFSFQYAHQKNVKVKSESFNIKNVDQNTEELVQRILDDLQMQENIKTSLIVSPDFTYYPISLDKFINTILEREFR